MITSDNAKTYLSTSNHLKKVVDEVPLESFLTRNRIQWKFITAKSHWQGGFYERLVGVTKNTLYKAIGSSRLKFRELETVLIHVEGILNNRPLVYQSQSLEDKLITPNHLIYGESLLLIGEYDHEYELEEDLDLSKRMRFLREKKEHAWKRWLKEYILSLREYHRSNQKTVNPPRIGQLILVVDNSIRKCYWQTGKVVKHLKGKDVVRAVKIQVISRGRQYEIERPIQLICPLEFDAPVAVEETLEKDTVNLDERPKRLTTFAGEDLRKLQTDFLNQED